MTATGRFNMASINASEFEIQNKKTITATVVEDVKAGDKVIIDMFPPEDTPFQGFGAGGSQSTYFSPDENLALVCNSGSLSILLYAKNPTTKKYERQKVVPSTILMGQKPFLTISPDWKYIFASGSSGSYYPTIGLLEIIDEGGGKYRLEETSTSYAFGEANKISSVYWGEFYDNRTAAIPTSSGIKIWRINEDKTVTTVQTIGALNTLRHLKFTSTKEIALASCVTKTTPLLGWDVSYDSGTDVFTFSDKTIPYEVTTHGGLYLDINAEDDRVALTSGTRVTYSRHIFFWEIDGDGDLNVIPWPGSGTWNVQYDFNGNPVFSKTQPYMCLVSSNVGGNRAYIIDTTSVGSWTPITIDGTIVAGIPAYIGCSALADGSFIIVSSGMFCSTIWYYTAESKWKYGSTLRGLQTHGACAINTERTYAASALNVNLIRFYKKSTGCFYDMFSEHVGTGTPSGIYCITWLDETHLLTNHYSSVASERLKLFTINKADDSISVSYADVSIGAWNATCAVVKGETDWYFTIASWTSSTTWIYKIDLTANTITRLANPASLPETNVADVRTYGTDLLFTSSSTTTTDVCFRYELDETGETPTFTRNLVVPVKPTAGERFGSWNMFDDTTSIIESSYNNYMYVYKLIEGVWVKQDSVWNIQYPTTVSNSKIINGFYIVGQPGATFNGYNQLTVNDEGEVRETFYSSFGSLMATRAFMPNSYPDILFHAGGSLSIVNPTKKLAYKIVAAGQNSYRYCCGYVKYDTSAGNEAVILMELASS